ncbi:surface protease GP63 [Trypanosoma theileri]|uniref:Leishmanolysin-like peptidase n=1 Tax=Trypanosoma theileri TaxID=67003 RepID=A0A1X0NVE0_9TRYP|nr:surface protease GP63 [Trypanosoma theileri]ORC88453.1 surface protease GP63 [Trypanosoma theileri]
MEKHSMRHLLWAVLFLLYCSCGCLAAVVQQLPQKGESGLQAYTVSTDTNVRTENWQPIRIGVYTKYVEDAVKYCEENKDLDFEHGVDFDDVCDKGGQMMTTDKKDTLLNKVLPKAIKLHTDRLKVERVEGSPKKPNVDVENIPQKCKYFKEDSVNLQESPDVDFMIFVHLSAFTEKVEICTQDGQKRPTSAVISFIPEEIEATRKYIRLTAHEIAHGLGFQHKVMEDQKMVKTRDSGLLRESRRSGGRQFYMVISKKTVEMMEKHYKCEDSEKNKVNGLYLEQKGNEETRLHWERLIAKDELMSPYTGEPTGMYYTVLTLAVFADMKFYEVNFSMAEPMSWGNQSGCEFLQGEKVTTKTDYPNVFCKKEEKTETKILQCTSDRFALGMCSTKKSREGLPDGYRYFDDENYHFESNLMDGVPFIRPLMGTACEGGNPSLMPGSVLGPDSRCLTADGLVLRDSKSTALTIAGVCAKVKCEDDKKVSVQLKQDGGNNWHDCSQAGKSINLVNLDSSTFSSGSIKCPKYEEVCTGLPKTESTKIKFYNGTGGTAMYEVDANDDEQSKKGEKATEGHNRVQNSDSSSDAVKKDGGGVPAVVLPTPNTVGQQEAKNQVVSKATSQKNRESGKDQSNDLPSVGPAGSGIDSAGSANNNAVGSNRGNASSGQQRMGKIKESESTVIDAEVQPGLGSSSSLPAADAPSTSNPNGNDNTVQSTNTINAADGRSSGTGNNGALNGTKLTEDKMKKETPNHTNIMGMLGPDSSIMVSYMAPLALLVCVVGFVMVP